MKIFLMSLSLIWCVVAYSQSEDKAYVDYNLKIARQALKDSNELKALKYYHKVYTADYEKLRESEASNKIINILWYSQVRIFTKMQGTWIFKKEISSSSDYQKLIIEASDIKLFRKENDTAYIRKERRVIPDPEDIDYFQDNMVSLKFSTGEVWEFKIKNVNTEDRLFTTKIRSSEGYTIHTLLNTPIVQSDEEWQEYLEKEKRPYYIRVNK